jgi:hypothetical protein
MNPIVIQALPNTLGPFDEQRSARHQRGFSRMELVSHPMRSFRSTGTMRCRSSFSTSTRALTPLLMIARGVIIRRLRRALDDE